MLYRKEHDEWNKLKKIIDGFYVPLPFCEREIWWVMFGTNVGIEIDGKDSDFVRPAVIVKKFSGEHLWVVPLSHATKVVERVHVLVSENANGPNGYAVTNQLRTISQRRLVKRIGVMNKGKFSLIVETVKKLLP